MALTERLIRKTYQELKDKANFYLSKKNVQKGLLYTHLAAYTNYVFWLSYFDDDIELLAKKAGNLITMREYNSSDTRRGRVVMLDSMARYRGGLTVQYINAIISAGWELLYITEQEMDAPHHKELYDFIKSKQSIIIIEVPQKFEGIERLQFVYNTILNFGAEKLYFHGTTSDAFFTAICYSLPTSIKKYFIDVADHGFRMGMQACDCIFEFRDLGCSIATQVLHIPKQRLLMLPFYPVIDNFEFKGLPTECNGKIKILSGGIFWKIIDKNDTYFKLCQKILRQNPNTVILYPGGGDSSFVMNKIKEYGLEKRFLLLGWRDDISELFRIADVFLNTYPHGGGTMSLYAAHMRVPILSYRPIEVTQNPVENFVCQLKRINISSTGEDDFIEEAHRLIADSEYRNQKAEITYSCILNQGLFNQYFKIMSDDRINLLPFDADKDVKLSHDRLEKSINYQNETGEYQMRLVALAGLNSITLKSDYIVAFIKKIIPKLKRVIVARGFHFNRL